MDTNEFEISAEAVREKQRENESLTLLDIRRPRERKAAALPDDLWIEMPDLPDRIEDLEAAERPIVVYCHHGMRSMKITRYLRDRGFEDVYSLAGGIDYWARRIDESMERY